MVCWQSDGQDGSGCGIYAQLFNNSDTKLGQEFQVNTYTMSDQGFPCVSGLSGGGFVVCWQSSDQDGDGNGIFGQVYDSIGTKQGEEFQVNTYTNSGQLYPSVCGLSDGGFVICWESMGQDGSYLGVFGQVYDQMGIKQGEEFQVNTYTYDAQWSPSVSSLPNGDFVVCWSSRCQDSGYWSIYGKYYLKDPILHSLKPFSLKTPYYDETIYSSTVNFQWQKASQIHLNFFWELEYTLHLDITENFSNPKIFSDIYDTTFYVTSLTLGQTYFWKVMAKNIEGDSLWSSETFVFYISPAAGIEDDHILKPEAFKLYPNYPNPFNPKTMINYELPITNYVDLNIYNLLGQKVATLVSERQNAGHHQIEWEAGDLSSGVYYYMITAGEFQDVKKMLLVK